MKPKFGLADIIRPVLQQYNNDNRLTANQQKALTDIVSCRTASLGGHIERCDNCKKELIAYNSCRNTNCPKCGGTKRIEWMLRRKAEMPPVPCFHIVFTVPDTLNGLFLKWPKPMYGILFRAAWETIGSLSENPKYLGAKPGMIAALHTWGQNLSLHPHVHCIVPGGGINGQNQWILAKKIKSRYLFPKRVLSKLFRGIFTHKLMKLHQKGEICMSKPIDPKNKGLHGLYRHAWVVNCQAPHKGAHADKLIGYLSHYINRTAISNERIIDISGDTVTFAYKDYRDSQHKQMPLGRQEFIRRFLMHVLPKGFRKIRNYGFLSNRKKRISIFCINLTVGNYEKKVAVPSDWKGIYRMHHGSEPSVCPFCRKGAMETKISFNPIRGDPKGFTDTLEKMIN